MRDACRVPPVGSLSGRAFRTMLVALLGTAFLGTSTLPAFAQAPPTPDASAVASQVKKFGVGKSVKVTLIGGERLSGHIRSISADSFTVKVAKTAVERPIPYDQVAEIKDPSPLFWMVVGATIVIVIIIIAHH